MLLDTLIQGAMNIGSAAISNGMAAERENAAAQRNYKYGELAAQNADRRTRALYQDLQSPEAMMRQIKEAGLSPSLMFGGGGVGGMSVPQGAQGGGSSGISPTSYGVDPVQLAQIENIKADTKLKEAEAETESGTNERGKAEVDKLINQVNNEWLTGEIRALDVMLKNFDVAIKGATGGTEISIKEQELENMIAEADNLRATLRSLKARGKVDEESANAIISYYKNRVIEQQADIMLKRAQSRLALANVSMSDAMAQKLLNDIVVNNEFIEISKRRVKVDEDKLKEQVKQWCIENGLKERGQNIAIADMVLDFILDNNSNAIKLIDTFTEFAN